MTMKSENLQTEILFLFLLPPMLVSLRTLFREFESCVLEDIQTRGKPALIYNYAHHQHALNAFDTMCDWEKERTKLEKKGWSNKAKQKQINIGSSIWNCIIWTYQPLDASGDIDKNQYQGAGGLPVDPLAASTGHHITGFCYLQLVKRQQATT